MKLIRPEDLAGREKAMDDAWKDGGIPAQQLALAQRELEEWRAGGAHGPFDALRSLLANLDRRAEVLIVGGGAGYETAVLQDDLGFRWVVNTDYSDTMVACAKAAWGEDEPFIVADRLSGRMRSFEVADARALPYGEQSFDLVLSGCFMLHMLGAGDRARSLAEAARVSRKRVLIHRTPVRPTGPSLLFTNVAYGVEMAEWHFSEEEYASLLAGAGLRVDSRVEWGGGDYVSRSDLCEKVTP